MAEIQFGLGTLTNDIFSDVFDISLPPPVVEQLNNKAGINGNGEFVFDHEGVSGRFGALDGEMEWNDGINRATYENELKNDGLKGVHRYTSGGDVDQFWMDLTGVKSWDSYREEGEISWDIDLMNMKMTFGMKDTKYGKGAYGQTADISVDAKLGIKAVVSDDAASITFSPEFNTFGIESSSPAMVSHIDHGDIAYNGTLEFKVPSLENCENYFTGYNFSGKSECQLNIESSDLPMAIVLKFKHKFAFLKTGRDIFYVKSENRKGDMVSFDKMMYLSFYATKGMKGRPFATIKRNFALVGEDLLATVPFVNAFDKEIVPAIDQYFKKWNKFFVNVFDVSDGTLSVAKAVYWMDKWVATVQGTTFDISDIVAATRIGCGKYPNTEIVEDVKALAVDLAKDMKEHQFELLKDAREFVNEIVKAEDEATERFALPA